MPENTLKIGVLVDKNSFDIDMQEVRSATKRAWEGISSDVKIGAASVRTESIAAAEATIALKQAYADLARASVVAKDANVSEAESARLVAAAQQNVIEKSEALVAAKEADAAATAEAAKEIELSSNAIVASFQRIFESSREAFAGVREQMVETAETAGVTGEGISAGFAGLSSLLGAGIAVGFAAHFLDEISKTVVELDHLVTQTGISISSLAGLQQIIREMGGDWEAVATGLIRMERAQAKAADGSKPQIKAFRELGVSVKDLTTLGAEDLLNRVAAGMAKTESPARAAEIAITLFGKGGKALIPVLKEQGAALKDNMIAIGAQTGVTESSAEAARRWTKDVADLGMVFRRAMLPVLENIIPVIKDIMLGFREAALVFEAFATLIVSGFQVIGNVLAGTIGGLGSLARVIDDLATGNIGKFVADSKRGSEDFRNIWVKSLGDVKANFAALRGERDRLLAASQAKESAGPKDVAVGLGVDPDPDKGRDKRLAAMEAELDEEKKDHEVSASEELNFWQRKLAHLKTGSQLYIDVTKKVVEKLNQLRKEVAAGEAERGKENEAGHSGFGFGPGSQNQKFIESLTSGEDFFTKWMKDLSETQKRTGDENVATMAKYFDDEYRAIAYGFARREQLIKDHEKLGLITPARAQQETTKLHTEEYQDESADLKKRMVALEQYLRGDSKYAADARKVYERLAQEKEQLDQRYAIQHQADTTRMLQLELRGVNAFFATFRQGMNSAIAGWIQGTESIGQAFARMLQSMVTQIAQWAADWLLTIAETWVKNEVLNAAGKATQTATNSAANITMATSDAGLAAAGTFAYYSAIFPPIAPAMAAAAYAEGMSFASLAAFERGGIVGGQSGMMVPILAHAGERVLTASQTQNFESMVNHTSSSNGGVHVHMPNMTLNGGATKVDADMLRDAVHDAVRRGLRQGHLRPA